MKKALITGVTGQDGSYLAELLISKGYQVCGLVRRSSSFNTERIDHLIENVPPEKFIWERADLTDSDSINRVLKKFNPNEIYHLGAQSHVGVSFEIPNYSFDVAANGTLRLLESIRLLNIDCKFYNACSSEMFGSAKPPQNEQTLFQPQSPYAVGKVSSHYLAKFYREAYKMNIFNGILFNHESPRRGETFVTRKITKAVSRIAYGLQKKLILGNLDSKRDWGYAPDYVEAMWLMLQSNTPGDYVIATGESKTVREFVNSSFNQIGITISWNGNGLNEFAKVEKINKLDKFGNLSLNIGDEVVSISDFYFRPAEVDYLLGNYSLAEKTFGWKPKVKFEELVNIMINSDMKSVRLILEGTKNNL